MACMTLFAQPITMATTQLVSAVQRTENFSWDVAPKRKHTFLRMNWVVVTDERGQRQLRMHWTVEDCGRLGL
jgi:hypothetical protein